MESSVKSSAGDGKPAEINEIPVPILISAI